jgi:aryl-alcohol dehydrogenase-like predicted oxidoreductase
VTKVGWRRDGAGGIFPAQSPGELRDGVEANLRSLRVERLDLVNLRLPGGDASDALADQLGALDELIRQGKIDLIGLSNVDRATLERGLELVDVAGIQNAYSVMDRQDDDLLAYCEEREIAFVPFGPLGSAYRRGPARLAAESAIGQVAAKHESTPTQIALAWLLAHSERLLLIPGTSSVAHLEENIAASSIELDDADLAALDRVGLPSSADG